MSREGLLWKPFLEVCVTQSLVRFKQSPIEMIDRTLHQVRSVVRPDIIPRWGRQLYTIEHWGEDTHLGRDAQDICYA